MTPKDNNWEKEFDKIAPAELEIDGYNCNLRPVIFPIKDFIRNLLEEQKDEAVKIIKGIKLSGLNIEADTDWKRIIQHSWTVAKENLSAQKEKAVKRIRQ